MYEGFAYRYVRALFVPCAGEDVKRMLDSLELELCTAVR